MPAGPASGPGGLHKMTNPRPEFTAWAPASTVAQPSGPGITMVALRTWRASSSPSSSCAPARGGGPGGLGQPEGLGVGENPRVPGVNSGTLVKGGWPPQGKPGEFPLGPIGCPPSHSCVASGQVPAGVAHLPAGPHAPAPTATSTGWCCIAWPSKGHVGIHGKGLCPPIGARCSAEVPPMVGTTPKPVGEQPLAGARWW